VFSFGLAANENVVEIEHDKLIDIRPKYLTISLIKVLEALDNPNGIINHSNRPPLFLKALFHSSPSLMRI